MKKSSQKRERLNWKKYSDLAVLEYLQENIRNPSLQTRSLNFLLWHGKHADFCKYSYYSLQFLSILCSGSIILLNSISFPQRAMAISAISVCVTSITGINMMMKFQENWLRYRKCYELVKSECFLYLMSSGRYEELSEPDKDNAFAEFLEASALQINADWLMAQKDVQGRDSQDENG